MRAFADAKDYKADTGEIIAGTEGATDDDFVSSTIRLYIYYEFLGHSCDLFIMLCFRDRYVSLKLIIE
jgi:hypothetical protein